MKRALGRDEFDSEQGPRDKRPGDVNIMAETAIAELGDKLAGLTLNAELIASVALAGSRVVRGGLAGVEHVVAALSVKAALRLE